MSPGRRMPWWYSGEDEPAEEAVEQGAGSPADEPGAAALERADAPSDARDDDLGEGDPEAGPPATVDWGALITGASRMVDWATSTVMAPHAQHEDPADHPQCVVCRTIVLVGDPSGMIPRPAPQTEDEQQPTATADPIVWIPISEPTADPTPGDQG